MDVTIDIDSAFGKAVKNAVSGGRSRDSIAPFLEREDFSKQLVELGLELYSNVSKASLANKMMITEEKLDAMASGDEIVGEFGVYKILEIVESRMEL